MLGWVRWGGVGWGRAACGRVVRVSACELLSRRCWAALLSVWQREHRCSVLRQPPVQHGAVCSCSGGDSRCRRLTSVLAAAACSSSRLPVPYPVLPGCLSLTLCVHSAPVTRHAHAPSLPCSLHCARARTGPGDAVHDARVQRPGHRDAVRLGLLAGRQGLGGRHWAVQRDARPPHGRQVGRGGSSKEGRSDGAAAGVGRRRHAAVGPAGSSWQWCGVRGRGGTTGCSSTPWYLE